HTQPRTEHWTSPTDHHGRPVTRTSPATQSTPAALAAHNSALISRISASYHGPRRLPTDFSLAKAAYPGKICPESVGRRREPWEGGASRGKAARAVASARCRPGSPALPEPPPHPRSPSAVTTSD